ncbi:MAG: DUF47 family protein [Armatimonadota bacterium]|nr:DUF47 family protein [Armatimonadota bacterium]MDR7436219.1 DUF47 family protein [Armatimonadota bacterium]MDR7471400.1 DUF47 family protein [Armatimonadota bacterium]MDR7507175.1 DUF47 family protein [Armatimonadota bacterium]MDR7516593.1 DUF47 family protein [Armatimonadota bacterium]
MDGDSLRPLALTAVAPPDLALLEEMTATIQQAAEVLSATLSGTTPVEHAWEIIRDLEHKGDAVAREVFEMLQTSRPTHLDREALKALTGYLDDVLDAIEAAAARLAIHRVRRMLPAARELAEVVLESARELRAALRPDRLRDLFPHTRTLHRLENRGDDVLRQAIGSLFAGRRPAREILKWQDICEILEAATDRCEDIANVMETLLVQAGGQGRLAVGQLVMDLDRHEVTVAGAPVALSAKEFGLLHLLLRHQGKVVRRERLLREVWGEDYFGDTRTLDTHIGWLRKKVEARGGVRIVAVRGIGYRLDLA